MNDKLIKELQAESEKAGFLAIDTIRYPQSIKDEMEGIAKHYKIKRSILLRKAVITGWKAMMSGK